MKKVFISLPMHGISHEEIERKLEKIRTDYRERLEKGLGDEIEFVDNLNFVPAVENPSRLNYLAGAIDKMASCDVLFLCDGWEEARGCRVEETGAWEYGIKAVKED